MPTLQKVTTVGEWEWPTPKPKPQKEKKVHVPHPDSWPARHARARAAKEAEYRRNQLAPMLGVDPTVFDVDPATAMTTPEGVRGKRFVYTPPSVGWSAAHAIVMCLATTDERGNLKRRPTAMGKKVDELIKTVGLENPIWRLDDLDAAAHHVGFQIYVLDPHEYNFVYCTSEEKDNKIYLLLDQKQGGYMACYNPSSL